MQIYIKIRNLGTFVEFLMGLGVVSHYSLLNY